MIYLFTNITDGSSDPKNITVADIDGMQTITVRPGESIDLELLSLRNQICVSSHIKVHVLEGRATVDTLGTEPDKDCRVWVTGIDVGDIVIDNVSLDEPIQISVDIGGTETALTGVTVDSHTYLDVNPLLPNTPGIECINIATANTEVPFALPVDARRFLVYLEEVDGYSPSDLEMGFDPGGNKISIPCGTNFAERDVDAGSVTLYFKTKSAPQVVKVLTWSVS